MHAAIMEALLKHIAISSCRVLIFIAASYALTNYDVLCPCDLVGRVWDYLATFVVML